MLIFYALGIRALPAVLMGALGMVPLVSLTVWATDLYRPVLGHCLQDRDNPKLKSAFRKGSSSYFGMIFESLVFFQVPVVMRPPSSSSCRTCARRAAPPRGSRSSGRRWADALHDHQHMDVGVAAADRAAPR